MGEGFKLFLIAALVGCFPTGCWRSAGIGGNGPPDGGDTETDTGGGITDPDTGGPWIYEWSFADVPTDDDLSGVHGFSSSDVFAVGESSTILRFDGTAWSEMAYPADAPGSDLGGVWGASPEDVFAVGSSGAIVHYDGSYWTWMSSGTAVNLHDVCGRGPDEVYAVGDEGTLLAFDGATWAPIETGVEQHLFAAFCGPFTAVYASGHANDAYGSSVLLTYDGAVHSIAHPVGHFMYALAGLAPDTVYLGGGYQEEDESLHFDIYESAGDGAFGFVATGDALLLDACAVDEGDVWAVGFVTSDPDAPHAVIHHVVALSLLEPFVFPSAPTLRGVWRDPGDPQGTVFAVGDEGTMLHGVPEQAY